MILTIKTQIIGIAIILVALAVLFVRNPVKKDTVARLHVLEETQSYVEIRAGEHVGRLYKEFHFDFAKPDFQSWFGDDGWTGIHLQSPSSPNAQADALLAQGIIDGTAVLGANQISAVAGAARIIAADPFDDLSHSSAVLENGRLWFIKGDDLWFRARFLVEYGMPKALVVFADNSTMGNPGVQIVINNGGFIGIAPNTGKKTGLSQSDVEIPMGRWFDLSVHLVLHNQSGLVQVWQDDQLILHGTMKTLPTAGALLNLFQIGISATDAAAEILVDDVVLSHDGL